MFNAQEFKNFWKKGSFVILSISDILGSLVVFPSTCYIQWWLANGWDDMSLAFLSVVFAFALAGPESLRMAE
jgi:Co/Zn/Cd efflux system component